MSNNSYNTAHSNMGAMIALSKLNTTPISDDIIGELESLTGLGITVEKVDTTPVSSTTGMSRVTPTTKSWGDITITVFKNNNNFSRVFNQIFGYNTSEDGFYCDLTIIWPKPEDWKDINNITLHGYLSGFNWSDITKDDVQKITFNFQPSGNPVVFSGFSGISSVSASPSTLDYTGGEVVITVVGTDLSNGILVKGFVNGEADPLTIGYTTGTSTTQSATVNYPANNGDDDKVYTIKASINGGVTYSKNTTTVTVEYDAS